MYHNVQTRIQVNGEFSVVFKVNGRILFENSLYVPIQGLRFPTFLFLG